MNRILKEFQERAAKHKGETVNAEEADCAYWLKHWEAALIVASVVHGSRRDDLPPEIKGWYSKLCEKLARQWVEYDKAAPQ